ncbi:MAG: hypothetical protein PHW20_05415, partial [Clostridia bacterium]|nr:hypothetical protein [Clostridia bacterium]
MKKILVIFLILLIVLTGCETITGGPLGLEVIDEGQDYNQFLFRRGTFTWTKYGIYTVVNNKIRYLDKDDNWNLLCFDSECEHDSVNCSAYVETSSIFTYDDQLYYVLYKDNKFTLNKMDLMGKNREQIKILDINETEPMSTFECQIANNYLVLNYRYLNEITEPGVIKITNESATYVTSLDKQSPTKKFLSGYSYVAMISDYWLFYIQSETEEGIHSLKAYNFDTEKTITVFDNYNSYSKNVASIYNPEPNIFYWFNIEQGFMKMDTETLEKTVIKEADSRIQSGGAIYDDKYVYVTNSIPTPDNKDISDEQLGVYIYDHDGNYIDFVSTSN